jgi:16S rRNA (cytidine1402-2'-O)-methyltransferase
MCRELSKKFEEVLRSPLGALDEALADRELRGECVLVIGPGAPCAPSRGPGEALADDAPLKRVAAVLAQRWGVPRKTVYNRLLVWERETDGQP